MSSTRRQFAKSLSAGFAGLLGLCLPQRVWAFHRRHRGTSCCPPPCPAEFTSEQVRGQRPALLGGTYTICFPLQNMQVPSCGGAAVYVWGYGLAPATKAVCTWGSSGTQNGTAVAVAPSLGSNGWAYYFQNLQTNTLITLTVSGGTGTTPTTVQFTVN